MIDPRRGEDSCGSPPVPLPPQRLRSLVGQDAPLTVLRGPHGHDKERLIRWWASARPDDAIGVCVVPGHDWDSPRLWRAVASALTASGAVAQSGTAPTAGTAFAEVSRLLEHLPRRVRLALPGISRLTDREVDEQIRRIVDTCHSVDVAVGVTGRSAFRDLYEPICHTLDTDLLRHTVDDVRDVFTTAGVDARPGEIEEILRATAGLPALTYTAMDVVAALPEIPLRHHVLSRRMRDAVSAHIRTTVLGSHVAAEHRSFLERVVAAHAVTVNTARFLSGSSDPVRHLVALEEGGILAYRDSANGPVWVPPQALRDVLLDDQRSSGLHVDTQLSLLAYHHHSLGEYALALQCATESRQWVLVSAIVDRHLSDLIDADLTVLGAALRALPGELLATRPRARAARSLIEHLGADRPRTAPVGRMTNVRSFTDLAHATFDSILARLAGEYDETDAVTARLRRVLATLDDRPADPVEMLPFIRMQWALTHQLAGNFPDSLAELGIAYRLGDAAGLNYIARNAAGNAALAWAFAGDHTRAQEWLALEHPHAPKDRWTDELTRVGGLVARMFLALDVGDAARAASALARLEQLPPVVELWPYLMYARCRHALSNQDPYRASAHLAEVDSRRRQASGTFVRSLVDAVEIDVHLALGDGVRALRVATSASRTQPWDVVASARAHLLTGRYSAALAACGRYDWLSTPYTRFQLDALLVQAVALHETGRAAAARRFWRHACGIADSSSYPTALYRFPHTAVGALAADTGIPFPRVREGLAHHPEIRTPHLTSRELEVLRCLARRLRTVDIATQLHLSVSTVKSHLRTLYRKLDVHTRGDAVDAAHRLGLLDGTG
ncbi:LuxR C-terminal-related transcriptional regulator [Prescottella sp. R16]|uniref:helix-turn-helix transcriptional regulator n=1 Tax=Prescottella sp. R16 TaxID=3064529 RepID=UPI00272DEA06|nr:LuxR C-terminal-related transcriptional regulator [Prescottella sp. R16]